MRMCAQRPVSVLATLVAALLCSAVCAGAAFADAGEQLAVGTAGGTAVITSAEAEAGEVFTAEVEGVNLVFQVLDADARTVRLGMGEGRGNGLAGLVYPADHKVVVPASVEHGGQTYAVKEIADYALSVQNVTGVAVDLPTSYIGEVEIRANLDWVGDYAFAGAAVSDGTGSSARHNAFSYRLEDGASIKRIAVTAFTFCGMDELEFPEGSEVVATKDSANLYGFGTESVVYPLGHAGTVYCKLSSLKRLYVKSPYSTIDNRDNYESLSVSLNAWSLNGRKRIPYYAWPNTQAADIILNGDRVNGYVYYRSMAAFSDWACPTWAVPEGSAAYTCKANVELGIEDGAVYPSAPKPTAKCVDDDGEWTLELGKDYTVEYFNADGLPRAAAPTSPGTYGVRFVGNNKSTWGSTDVISYSISADLSDATVDYDASATVLAYTGAAQSPAVTVMHAGSKLVEAVEYYVRYFDAGGVQIKNEPTLPGKYVKRIASRTPYTGLAAEIPFEIRAVSVASVEVPTTALVDVSATPRVTAREADGTEIASSAYKSTVTTLDGVEVTGKITQLGAYRIKVAGDGKGCTGSAECTFSVVAAERMLASAEQADALTYAGAALSPAFSVKDAAGLAVPAGSYAVAYADADGNPVARLVDAGTYTATLTATGGSYAGSVTCSVVVAPRALVAADVQVTVNRTSYDYIKSLDWAKVDGYDEGTQPRDKARVYLSASIAPAADDFSVTLDGAELVAGSDFSVAIDDRVRSDEDDQDHKSGFTVTLLGNYAGTVNGADLEGKPTVTINKRIAHTVWYKGVLFSYAVDVDGLAVITGLGVDLSTSTQASDIAAAYRQEWGNKVTVPDTIVDGGVTYQVKAVCPNAFSVPRDGGNGSINSLWVFAGAKSLEIEAGIQVIGAQAFPCSFSKDRDRQGIEELVLHEGLRVIEPYGLSGASVKCKQIIIPASVERIGYAAFGQNMEDSALEKFEFADGSKFFGGSVEGIAEASDNISGGYVFLTGTRRYGGIIVDGGGIGAGTKENATVSSLVVPAQYTSAEALFTDFLYCSNVYWMADYIADSAATSLNSIAVKLAGSKGGEVTVWGWDNAGTNLPEAVWSNSSFDHFKPFAVLGSGYEYQYATGGAKTYPGNVTVGTPSVYTLGGKQAVNWDLQLNFVNRKYKWTPVEGEDFTVTYADPDGKPCTEFTEAGVYTATLTGNGLTCFGTTTAQVQVGTELPADLQVTFADGTPAGYTYDGTAHAPVVEAAKLPSAYVPLDPESEYTVSYQNNVNAGTMRVIIEGCGGYFGTVAKEFRIAPASIAGQAVELAWTSKTYSGKAQKPAVAKVGGKALKLNTDYAVKYSNASSKAGGSYTVSVTGKGNYAGAAKVATYKITQAANSAKAKWTSKTYKLKANKKTKKLAKATKVALPSVTKKYGTVKWTVKAKDKKKVLSLAGGKVKVKKGAKRGTYTIKLVAKVAATKSYKAAASKSVTVKVRIA